MPDTPFRGVALRGVSAVLPANVVHTHQIAARVGVSEDWMVSRTGIRERRWSAPEERLSDLAAAAGAVSLERAGVSGAELDLVLVATMTQDEVTPNTAPLVAHALGANRAGAIDIGAACTAWVSAVALGTGQIEAGRARNVLVIGADFISRITDHEDKRTAGLFADGAGAVVLTPGEEGGPRIGPVLLRADGGEPELLYATLDDRKLRMDGPEVFRHAVRNMSDITREVIAEAGLELDDIDLFVYHQANQRILSAVANRLKLTPDRVVDCIGELGNASAATVPVALARAEADGRLRPGMRVLISAFGAGFTWGGAVLEWDDA